MDRTNFTKRRLVTALAAASTLTTVVVGAVGTPVGAAGLVPSTTLVAGTLSADGQTIAVSATVEILKVNLGLGVTPKGTVSFTDSNGTQVGSATLPTCLLTACTVGTTIDVSALSNDTTSITATYSGDTLLQASSASFPVLFEACPSDIQGPCEDVQIGDSTEDVHVVVPAGDAAVATLGGPALPCSLGVASVVNTFGSGSNATPKEIGIDFLPGTPANTYKSVSGATFSESGHMGYLCAVEPYDFLGFWPGGTSTTFDHTSNDFNSFGMVPQLTSGPYAGQYVGLLANCNYTQGSDTVDPSAGPCTVDSFFDSESGTWVTFTAVPSGDPHFGG